MIIILPLLVCIIGLVIYALTTNTKVGEIGRTMMWTGMLVSLFVAAHHTFGELFR